MTNQEKFIEVMNNIFDAGLTTENMRKCCSPCGALKKFEYACKDFSCNGCKRWWDKEYHRIEQSSHPLTLDELNQMVEEPVWIESPDMPNLHGWAINYGLDPDVMHIQYAEISLDMYGKTWLAYRRRPEEEHNEQN